MQYKKRLYNYDRSYENRKDFKDIRVCFTYDEVKHISRDYRSVIRRSELKRRREDNKKSFVRNKHLRNRLYKVANISIDENELSEKEEKKLLLKMIRQRILAKNNH